MGSRNGTGSALQTVIFHEPKAGSAASEWEDGAGFSLFHVPKHHVGGSGADLAGGGAG